MESATRLKEPLVIIALICLAALPSQVTPGTGGSTGCAPAQTYISARGEGSNSSGGLLVPAHRTDPRHLTAIPQSCWCQVLLMRNPMAAAAIDCTPLAFFSRHTTFSVDSIFFSRCTIHFANATYEVCFAYHLLQAP